MTIKDLINKQFEIAGYNLTYDDVLGQEDWLQRYPISAEKRVEFMSWMSSCKKKVVGVSNLNIQVNNSRFISMFDLQYGLRLMTPSEEKEHKVKQILRNHVAFKKKASDNKGRNQGKKATGKPKVSENSKTT